MKPSSSLTSLSSVDKDLYLSSLTNYGRMGLSDNSLTSNYSSFRLSEEALQLQKDGRHQQQKEDKDDMPSIPNKRRKRYSLITANLCGTRYEVVRQTVEKLGFTVVPDDDPTSYLIWNDSFVLPDRVSELKQYQRLNHFPGMGEISRKDSLARNFTKMQKAMPDVFNYFPKTWVLPADYTMLQMFAKDMKARKKNVTFIVKPANGAQGHGISLYKNAEKIPSTEHFIVQKYIDKPLLLDGYKFDLRIYVLVTSCDPLRIFLYTNGLVRLATEKYLHPQENNINHLFMHLTNYSVNKHNDSYDKNMAFDTGSKRSIRFFNEYLRQNNIDVNLLWRRIADMIVQTLLMCQPHVLHAYRMCRPGAAWGSSSVCFEILGFDVLIDRKLQPWLLEINRSPSFGTDQRLDFEIKSALLEDTLRLLNIRAGDKRKNIQAQKAAAQRRLFKSNRKMDANEVTELDRRKANNEKKKEELKELLARVRKINAKEDFERRNCGRFRRIFPSDNNDKQQLYCRILSQAFSFFLAGRDAVAQKEIKDFYGKKYKEEDILDMIAECEAEEKGGHLQSGSKLYLGPKPLQSMPESLPPANLDEKMDQDSEDSLSTSSRSRWHRSASSGSRSRSSSRPGKSSTGSQGGVAASIRAAAAAGGQRPVSQPLGEVGRNRSRSLPRATAPTKLTPLQRSNVVNFVNLLPKDKMEDMTKKTLTALEEMRIKFPGKSDQEANFLLEKINQNWSVHKPKVAAYWLVRLDSAKRKKVIDIVKHNVTGMLQHVWHTQDTDSLRLGRMFGRLFNRLLWSHGQGLWHCFSSKSNVWETIFCKSGENITDHELECCRRIVRLCQDCLLIVYKFADETRNLASVSGAGDQGPAVEEVKSQGLEQNGYTMSQELKPISGGTPYSRHSQMYRSSQHLGLSSS